MKIIGIKTIQGKVIFNKKGDILKFVSKNETYFKKFGEIYFTEIKKNKIKGWNFHKKNTCLLVVPYGKVVFKFVDGRPKSKSYNYEDMIVIGKKKYKIILLPPRIWFSFKSLTNISLVANCLSNPHSDNETLKKDKIKNYRIRN